MFIPRTSSKIYDSRILSVHMECKVWLLTDVTLYRGLLNNLSMKLMLLNISYRRISHGTFWYSSLWVCILIYGSLRIVRKELFFTSLKWCMGGVGFGTLWNDRLSFTPTPSLSLLYFLEHMFECFVAFEEINRHFITHLDIFTTSNQLVTLCSVVCFVVGLAVVFSLQIQHNIYSPRAISLYNSLKHLDYLIQ